MNTNSKRALITGVYGQDGSYLTELLLRNGYFVRGVASEEERAHPMGNILTTNENFSVSFLDIRDVGAFKDVTTSFQPDEFYNLAAVSDLKTAQENPGLTYDINFRAFHDSARVSFNDNPSVRIFQALSSRILIPDQRGVITEQSALKEGVNMYDIAKRDSLQKTILPLRSEGCFISSGFLCNHESPRRGERFVTGKIAKTVVAISRGIEDVLSIGNVDALRDWSHAIDIVSGMHAILMHNIPDDYVVGSGELHSVRDFIDEAFRAIDMPLRWTGSGVGTLAYDDAETLRVQVDPLLYRPDDNSVVSDTSRLENETHWKRMYSFKELVTEMVEAERALATQTL